MKKHRIINIFDTTLRDGEQSPGASMSIDEKVKIAIQLEKLGVDTIEAGFPVSSPAQFEAVKRVSEVLKKSRVTALARAVELDIDSAAEALKSAKKNRIHTFIATSPIHMKYKLKKGPEQVIKMAVHAVEYACERAQEVEFSAEDATRSDWKFLVEIVQEVIDAGASIINIPDTVGYTIPMEFIKLINYIFENVRNIKKAMISVHCHNDLGMGVANSLAAVSAGAGQIECTINGLGERAGNASLEEIVMAIKTRADFFKDITTNIDTKEIYRTSKLVSAITGIAIPLNKAIVGKNAFAHESGIHQDGVLKEKSTYEILTPESIGLKENNIVLGRHSGRHGFKARIEKLGIKLNKDKLEKAYERFLEIADKKKEVYDDDLYMIVNEGLRAIPEFYKLTYFQVISGTDVIPTATIKISINDQEKGIKAGHGDGPIDAIYKLIEGISGKHLKLLDFSIKSVTSGKDAVGEAKILAEYGELRVSGRAISTDVVEAAVEAYIDALNKIIYQENIHK